MLHYSATKILKVLLLTVALLAVLHVGASIILVNDPSMDIATASFFQLFNMDNEVSIPTWFEQMLLAVAGTVALLIAYCARQKESANREWRYWLGLGLIFVGLSIDEGAGVHELFGSVVSFFTGDLSGTIFNFSWVIAGILFVGAVAAVVVRFIFALPRRTYMYLFLSAALFISGAIGAEMFGGYHASNIGWDFSYSLFVLLEEVLEMTGISIFVYALLDYATSNNMKLTLTRSEAAEPVTR